MPHTGHRHNFQRGFCLWRLSVFYPAFPLCKAAQRGQRCMCSFTDAEFALLTKCLRLTMSDIMSPQPIRCAVIEAAMLLSERPRKEPRARVKANGVRAAPKRVKWRMELTQGYRTCIRATDNIFRGRQRGLKCVAKNKESRSICDLACDTLRA